MGIREGLMLRQYIDERGLKAEEMKNRAALYKAQSEGYKAETQLKLEDAANRLKLRNLALQDPAMREILGLGPAPGGDGGAAGPVQETPGPQAPRRYSSALEQMLTQYQGEGADVSVTPPPTLPPGQSPGQASMGTAAPGAPGQMPEPSAPMDLGGASPGQQRKQAILGQTPAQAPTPDIPQPAAQGLKPTPPGRGQGQAPAQASVSAAQGLAGQGNKAQIEQMIRREAQKQGVDPDLAVAVATQESSLDPQRIGDNGASIGLFQLQEGAARDAGIDPNLRHDPQVNTVGGVAYLKQKLAQANGNVDQALSLYNRGTPTYEGKGDPNYEANVKRYYKPGGGQGRAPEQRVAGPGAPAQAPAPAPTGGLETTPATPPRPPAAAPAPVDPQLGRFEAMRRRGQWMVLYGQEKEGTNYLNTVNAMETAYRLKVKQDYLDQASLRALQLQNPGLPATERQRLQGELAYYLIRAQEVTNAREFSDPKTAVVPQGGRLVDTRTGRDIATGEPPLRNVPPGTTVTQQQPSGEVKPLYTAPPRDTQQGATLLELYDRASRGDKEAIRILDERERREKNLTSGRAEGGTRERLETTEEVKRGQAVVIADRDLAEHTFVKAQGRLIDSNTPYGEVVDKTGRGPDKPYVHVTRKRAEKLHELEELLPVLNLFSERYQKLYGPGGAYEQWKKTGRLKTGAKGTWAQFVQSDENLSTLVAEADGLATRLGRVIGSEVGNLSDIDTKRMRNMLGQIGALPSSPEVAFNLLNDMFDLSENVSRIILDSPEFRFGGAANRPPRTGQAAPAAQTPATGGAQTPPAPGRQETPEETENRIRKDMGLPPRK